MYIQNYIRSFYETAWKYLGEFTVRFNYYTKTIDRLIESRDNMN